MSKGWQNSLQIKAILKYKDTNIRFVKLKQKSSKSKTEWINVNTKTEDKTLLGCEQLLTVQIELNYHVDLKTKQVNKHKPHGKIFIINFKDI